MNLQKELINMILQHEGGYVNDIDDLGKRTYCGISENNFPDWDGWKVINNHEPLKRNEIIKDTKLDEEIYNFYLLHFFYKLKIDQIKDLHISAHLLDHGINAGISNGVKCLQKAINSISPANLITDGKIGTNTIAHTNSLNPVTLLKELIKERQTYYTSITKKNPKQEKFLKGWLNRIDNVDKFINNLNK